MPGSEGNPPLESFGQHGQVGRTFVGRERELSELRASLASVAGGRGQLFCLIGEPGIGKTRLTEEIAAEAERGGAKVAWGRCWREEARRRTGRGCKRCGIARGRSIRARQTRHCLRLRDRCWD